MTPETKSDLGKMIPAGKGGDGKSLVLNTAVGPGPVLTVSQECPNRAATEPVDLPGRENIRFFLNTSVLVSSVPGLGWEFMFCKNKCLL